MKKFLIAEAEKSRILGMHYNAMGKTLVNEQAIPDSIWVSYLNSTEKAKPGSTVITSPPDLLSNEQINAYKMYDVAFYVTDFTGRNKQVQYQCIDSEPGEVTFKAGQIFDSSMELTNVAAELDASGIPWKQIFTWACKPAASVLAARRAKQQQPQPQVASAQVKGGVSPETQKQIDNAIRTGFMTKTVDPTTKAVKYVSTGKGSFTIGSMNINLAKGQDITRMVIP